MKTTIIIPTYNRAKQLDMLLSSLQSFNTNEIIIVDSYSTDGTEKMVRRHQLNSNSIRFLQIEEKSIPEARNYGVSHATGDVLIFVDSDITIEDEGWLDSLISPLRDGGIGMTYGRVVISSRTFILRYIEANHGLGTQSYGKKSFKVTKDNFVTFPMCNTAIRREVFERTGEFDINLRMGEDIDFCRRAIKHFDFAYVPEAVVEHHHRNTFFGIIKYGFNTGYFTHPLIKKYKKSEFDNRHSPKMLAVCNIFPFFVVYGILWLFIPLFASILAVPGYSLLLSRYAFFSRENKDIKRVEIFLYPFIDIFCWGACSFGHWMKSGREVFKVMRMKFCSLRR